MSYHYSTLPFFCSRAGLNRGPQHFQCCALPLSYKNFGAEGVEPPVFCTQNRRVIHYATPRKNFMHKLFAFIKVNSTAGSPTITLLRLNFGYVAVHRTHELKLCKKAKFS